jgi:hypothetical protein
VSKKQFFIVWNPNKTEGYITDSKPDAMFASDGVASRSGTPILAEALRDTYCEDADDGLPMQEIELEV